MPVLGRTNAQLRRRPGPVLAVVVALGSLPLLVALVALAGQDWHPVGDLAQAAMRQESFWAHPPLVGTAGRIGTLEQQGNHPGPAMFWFAWPVWRVLGASPWALEVASAAGAIAAYVAAVALAARALGRRVALAVAVAGAVLVRAFGPAVLTEPWNPSTPLMPYLLFVVACWTTATGRHRHLPVAVLAGSYCVQCHVGYAPAIVVGLVVAVGGLLLARRGDRAGTVEAVRWVAGAGALGLVLWLPPIVQELTGDPGNISIILDTYRDQTGEVIGFRQGLEVMATQLDPVGNVLRGSDDVTGSPWGGVVLVVGWAVSVVVAVRRRHRRLLALDAVLAVQLVAMAAWSVRLDSVRFPSLVQWFWVVTVLLVLATAWGLRQLGSDPTCRQGRGRRIARRLGSDPTCRVVAIVAVVVVAASGVVTASDLERPFPNLSDTVAAIDDPTASALDRDATYRVDWRDGDSLGAVGFGLMLALERDGYDVGAGPAYRAAVEPHRVLEAGEEDAVLTVVSGDDEIAAVRAAIAGDPDVTELVAVDARSAGDRARAEQLRADAEARLRAQGRDDLADAMDTSVWTPLVDPSLDDATYDELWALVSIGQPTVVFLSLGTLPSA